MHKRFNDARDWFFEKRFGLFVHWGLYAIPAWHEQILWRTKMKRSEYEKLRHSFNPTRFDPDRWLDIMEEAGMEYIVFTTKHHDGFCLWNTRYTDYNVMNTPFGRDVVEMLANACHKRNIPLGFYYSIPDWHHPNYPNQGRHHEMFGPRATDCPDREAYLEYVVNQMRELCTNYGEVHLIFWDVNVLGWYDPQVNAMIRSWQPKAVINDRGPDGGDFGTPERHVPDGQEFSRPTQACQSLGRESWGYKEDEDYYTAKYLIQSIDKVLAMGGSYLLNVGPKADGSFADMDIALLRRIGKWYKSVKEAFTGTVPASHLVVPDEIAKAGSVERARRDDFLLTRAGNTIYVHLYRDPQSTAVILKPIDVLPKKAIVLNTGEKLETRVDVTPWHWREKPWLRVRGLPVDQFADSVMVLKLEFAPEDID
ncbi:MAG TPA: glycoside hydrolase [Firmicutes bacterium]|nr:glycoside hydrolase [Bacillota bacterium]